ncbi:MAG: hypothetical protein NC913_04460 [Candidatus Omnitrophica bacterium]|nr:hypothetical protein [Candidatus Omnitrophota bacterium]
MFRKQRIPGLFLLFLIACFPLFGAEKEKQVNLSPYLMTKPQVLFSIKYGDKPSEIGLWIPGPEEGEPTTISDFAIGADGSIYIADRVNRKIKRFNRQGKLLMCTEDVLDGIEAIGVNKKGQIFVIYFGNSSRSNQIAVYDEKGKRVSDSEKRIEKLLEDLTVTDSLVKIEMRGIKRIPGLTWIWCDQSDNIYLRGGNIVFKIDAELKSASAFKKEFPYPSGRYSYNLLPAERYAENILYYLDGSVYKLQMPVLQLTEITVYNKSGSITKKFLLPKEGFSDIEKMVPIVSGGFLVDGKGNFYNIRYPLVCYANPLDKGKGLATNHFNALLEYDREGRFVGVRAIFDGFWIRGDRQIEVDPQGNVYYLDFKSDHVDVMMAPAPKEGVKRNK